MPVCAGLPAELVAVIANVAGVPAVIGLGEIATATVGGVGGLTVITGAPTPAPLFGLTVTPTGDVNEPPPGLIVPDAAGKTGAEIVQAAVPEAIEPPVKVTVLPEIVAVPPHELVTVAPAGKLKPAGNVYV